MKKIYTVWLCTELYEEEADWIDSYWTNEADAVAEMNRCVYEMTGLDVFDEKPTLLMAKVFERTLNVRGNIANEWDEDQDREVAAWVKEKEE